MYDVTGVSFPSDSKPFIRWEHADGPVLFTASGEYHWLTLFERLLFKLELLTIDDFDIHGKRLKFTFK